MSESSSRLVQKPWSFCTVLRDAPSCPGFFVDLRFQEWFSVRCRNVPDSARGGGGESAQGVTMKHCQFDRS